MSWCGQPWSSDELVAQGCIDVVYLRWPYAQTFQVGRAYHRAYDDRGVLVAKRPEHDHLVDGNLRYAGLARVDDDGRVFVPALLARWPRCPMCDAPLRRVKMSNEWICQSPQGAYLELEPA